MSPGDDGECSLGRHQEADEDSEDGKREGGDPEQDGQLHPRRGGQSDVTEARTDRLHQDDHREYHQHAGDNLGTDIRPGGHRGDAELASPS